MTSATPPEPERVESPGADRRWVVLPIVLVAFLVVAFVKPWGGRPSEAPASPPVALASPRPSPSVPAATASAVPAGLLPSAAEIVGSIDIDIVPWAHELAADPGGAWAWSDAGIVRHVGAATDTVTRIDLGGDAGSIGPLGSRGIALDGSQIWASDPAHRGVTRIDRETESVAETVELWSARQAAGVDGPSMAADRWASAWGFAVDGDSIFVPSLTVRSGDVIDASPARGEMLRARTTGGSRPDWLSIDHPSGLAVGFGSVWVVSCCGSHSDARTYSVVRLEQETGGIQTTITLPVSRAETDGRPVIRIGPDSVWVGLEDPATVVRIDPATSSIRSLLPMDLPVSDLAIGADGSVWVAETEAWYRYGAVLSDRCDGRLVRIDPVLERAVAATTVTCPMSVAVAGNDVWVGSAGTEPSATGGLPPRLLHMRALEPPG